MKNYNKNKSTDIHIVHDKKFYLFDYFQKKHHFYSYFNLTYINYYISYKFNIIKVEYNIGFYDENQYLILPSDLTLYLNLHLICYSKNENTNIMIDSMPNIYLNNYFKCIEFCNIKENITFGIKLYEESEKNNDIKYCTVTTFTEKIFDKNNIILKNDSMFDLLFISKEHNFLTKKFYNKNLNKTLKLKKTFVSYPYSLFKRDSIIEFNKWKFENIYNLYFCFCKGIIFFPFFFH